jgi:hypothetical protein
MEAFFFMNECCKGAPAKQRVRPTEGECAPLVDVSLTDVLHNFFRHRRVAQGVL